METTWIFRPSKLHWKRYVEMTCKFVQIWSLTYQHNIHIKSKSIQCRVSLGNYFRKTLHLRSVSLQCLYFWVLIFICSSFFPLMNIFQTSNNQTKGIVRSFHQKNQKKKIFFLIAGIKPYISVAILWKKWIETIKYWKSWWYPFFIPLKFNKSHLIFL